MTDVDFIKAFRENNQHAMTKFYAQKRDSFMKSIAQHFRLKDKDIIAEIYQEAVIRLWNCQRILETANSTINIA